MDDLLEFLDHASDRGLMPAATAQALAVAVRNALDVLTVEERADLGRLDIDAAIKRFVNKRAKDFSPSSLKEYGRRVHRANDLFLKWRDDPANFAVRTRTTSVARRRESAGHVDQPGAPGVQVDSSLPQLSGTYQSSFPIRPGVVVTLMNVPHDLTRAEADRLAGFVKMLSVE